MGERSSNADDKLTFIASRGGGNVSNADDKLTFIASRGGGNASNADGDVTTMAFKANEEAVHFAYSKVTSIATRTLTEGNVTSLVRSRRRVAGVKLTDTAIVQESIKSDINRDDYSQANLTDVSLYDALVMLVDTGSNTNIITNLLWAESFVDKSRQSVKVTYNKGINRFDSHGLVVLKYPFEGVIAKLR